jgi:hypothetical protein
MIYIPDNRQVDPYENSGDDENKRGSYHKKDGARRVQVLI